VRKGPVLSSALSLGIVLASLSAHSTSAQEWPERQSIKVIAPASPGSTVDVMARLVFEQVGRQLGQTVVVENREGAGTTIGMAYVAKSPPDGYTILVNSTSYAAVASTYAHLQYDPRNDMTGIALLAHIPFVVASSPKYKTLADIVAAGQQKPSSINFGTLGLGSAGQLATARLMLACNFTGTDVPFRGTTEALREVIAGRLDMYSGSFPNAEELAKSGQINLLGVMRPKRSTLFPEVPTTIEAGCPNSDYDYWMGAYLPAKAPRSIIERLNAEVNEALRTPEVKAKLGLLGGELDLMSVDQFNAFIAKERDLTAEIVKRINYQPQ
jgi:tripartite-type tricarboxylate transporter receptor subunit TctC